jgi:5-methylcytosine-specific restriction endonuclease McrA
LSFVFVVDTNKQPLNPVHPGRARLLLKTGKAAVLKHYPFTLVLKTSVEQPQITPLRLKLDPGSRTTGIALVNDQSSLVLFAAELSHRGKAIKDALSARRGVRRNRRIRHTRYRKPRFANRRRPKGWLAPSLLSRVHHVETWVKRLRQRCLITAISMELVRFDMQAMENPEINGVGYQQGMLAGYEAREYLLQKWDHKCAYCSRNDRPLQIEHIQPRARGGTDRIANLTLACEPCNIKKGTQDITVFLKKKPEVRGKILAQAKASGKDAAAVNTTRWSLYERLKATGLPVEVGTGGRTKFNRVSRGLEKTHWQDAACVGASTPEYLRVEYIRPLLIQATGHGSRLRCLMDRFGFPRTGPKAAKCVKGFQTGDLARAVVTQGARKGTHVGRVAVKASGYFTIQTKNGPVPDVASRYCHRQQRADGYQYHFGERLSPPPTSQKGAPVSSSA